MKFLALILCAFFVCVKTQEVVLIDNVEELRAVEGTTPSTCSASYADDHADLCKSGTPDSGTSGFWSSCTNSRCDISISLGKLGGLGKVPSSVGFLSYVDGVEAEISLRYTPLPGAQPIPIPGVAPVTNTYWDWSGPFDLTQLTLFPESELVLRLSSGPLDSDVDIVDKIVFTFAIDPPTTTTAPTTTTTTEPTTTTTTPTTTTTTEPTTTTTTPTTTTTTEPPTTTTTTTTTEPTTTTTTPTTTTTTEPTTTTTTPTTTTTTPTTTTTTPTTTTTTPSPTRPPVDYDCPTEDGLYADPKNCRGFYNCASWYPYHFCCPLPLFFNQGAQRCDFQDTVECNNDPGLPCDSPPGLFNLYSRN